MSTFASRVWRARNLVEQENNILVEWREIGRPPQSAVCGSQKCYRSLVARLKRQGYVHCNVWEAKPKVCDKGERELLLAFVRSVAMNQKDAIWQDEWFAMRDRALGLLQELSRPIACGSQSLRESGRADILTSQTKTDRERKTE